MDSMNLPDTQNIQISTENKASNTISSACAFCGSNDYMKTFSQANCFRTFYPGIPSGKQSDNCEDNFTIHQPIFSSPPFLPSFHNSPVPQNVCFGHSNSGVISPVEEKQKENLPENKSDGVKPQEANRNILAEMGPLFPGQNYNPYFQGCSCNSSIPWTCNPFIVPIISYYVLWNSQRANLNSSNANSCDSSNTKNDVEASNVLENQAVLNADSNNKSIKNSEARNNAKESNKKDCCKGKESVQKKFEHKTPSNIPQKKKSDNVVEREKMKLTNTKEEKENEKIKMVEIQSSETDLPNVSTSSESEINTTDCCIGSEELVFNDMYKSEDFEIKTSETNSELNSLKDTLEDSQEENIVSSEKPENLPIETGIVKEREQNIKLIKNFTMTDQTSSEFSEESASSVPVSIAAGDLGGENCVGFKINILDLGVDIERNDNQPEEKINKKDSKCKQPPMSVETECRKLSHTKNQQNCRSGSAKHSTNSLSKNCRAEALAAKKDILKKPAGMRGKHNCLFQQPKKDDSNFKVSKSKTHRENFTGTSKQVVRTKIASMK